MVWSASTLWAETSEGKTKEKWKQNRAVHVQAKPPRLDDIQEMSPPRINEETGEIIPPPPRVPPLRLKKALNTVRELRSHHHSKRTLSPAASAARTRASERNVSAKNKSDRLIESPIRAQTTEPQSDSHSFLTSLPQLSQVSGRQKAAGDTPGVSREVTPLPSLRRGMTLPPISSGPVQDLIEEKKEQAHSRNLHHWEHLKEVQSRAEAKRDAKRDAIQAEIQFKEKRFLDPIDRCDTMKEKLELCAQAWSSVTVHAKFASLLIKSFKRHRAARVLATHLTPIVRRIQRRHYRLSRVYSLIWMKTIAPPTPERLVQAMPALASWPRSGLLRVCRCSRPTLYPRGTFIVREGEPISEGLFVNRGSVEICQKVDHGQRGKLSHMQFRILGTRAAPTMQGEEILACVPMQGDPWIGDKSEDDQEASTPKKGHSSPGPSSPKSPKVRNRRGAQMLRKPGVPSAATKPQYFASLRAAEETVVWRIPRKAFWHIFCSTPGAHSITEDSEAALLEPPPAYIIPTIKIRNENSCFTFWNDKQILALLAEAPLKLLRTGDVLYSPSDRADSVYLVWKGTLEVEFTVLVPSWAAPERAAKAQKTIPKVFRNPPEAVAVESLIYGGKRDGTAIAITDVVVFEIQRGPLMRGMYLQPTGFLAYIQEINESRAARLAKPTQAELATCFVNAAITPIHKLMVPKSFAKGSTDLPFKTCIFFLAEGKLRVEDEIFSAPSALAGSEAFREFPAMVKHEAITRVDVWLIETETLKPKLKQNLQSHVREILGPRSNVKQMIHNSYKKPDGS